MGSSDSPHDSSGDASPEALRPAGTPGRRSWTVVLVILLTFVAALLWTVWQREPIAARARRVTIGMPIQDVHRILGSPRYYTERKVDGRPIRGECFSAESTLGFMVKEVFAELGKGTIPRKPDEFPVHVTASSDRLASFITSPIPSFTNILRVESRPLQVPIDLLRTLLLFISRIRHRLCQIHRNSSRNVDGVVFYDGEATCVEACSP